MLRVPDIEEIPCEIRNFCQAGLLLKPNEPGGEKGLAKNQRGVEVVLTDAKTATTFHMGGRLSHVSANGVGFVFDSAPPFQVLQALQERAVPNPVAERKIPTDLAEIHAQCLQAFENALYPLLDSLPAQIEAGFAEAEQAAEPPAPLTPLVERFYAHILEQARSFVVPDLSLQPEAGAIYSESQSQRLMFEDWMNLIDKVILLETKYESVLRLLESRFGVLVRKDVANHDNPFGPNVICHSFHYSLQGVELDNLQRNLVYEAFTRLLDERLAKLYNDLRTLSKPLDAFKSDDAKPEEEQPSLFVGRPAFSPLAPSFAPEEEKPKAGSDAPPSARPPEKAATPAASKPAAAAAAPKPEFSPPPPDAYSAFVVLFRYAESQAAKGPREEATTADRAAIIAALRKLQADRPGFYFIAPKLQAGLSHTLAQSAQEKLLSKAEIRENLQILGLLLDSMLADLAIPPSVMPYLKKMQIPLLAGSFIDPHIVHGHHHPAREILNQLDRLTQAANAQGEIDNAELLHALDAIFERIAREGGSNPHVFADAQASLDGLTAPLMKAYATRLERLAEACEGGQKLEQARRLVDLEIDARLGGKTVPSILLALLDAGWRQLLVLTHLRQGVDNDDWRRQLAVVELLMSWLGPKPPANPPSPQNIQSLKSYVDERLAGVGSEPAETARILEKLGGLLLNSGGEAGAAAHVEVPPMDTSLEEKQSMLRDRLQGFREGEWLKFASTRGAWIPLRLSWIGKKPARYVFANRKGIKTLDLDAVKFIQFLDEKRASRMENLDTLNLVERTAKGLMSTLRDRLR